jgi:hypothetical protein
MKRVAAVTALAALTGLATAVPASAAPVVRQATGANVAGIQAAVDAFEEEVGAEGCSAGPPDSGCRQIVWDGVPDSRSAPLFMPEAQFRDPQGALFTTPGTGVQVSGDDDSADADPLFNDPDLVQFTSIDVDYDDAFAPFSGQRLFSSIDSNVIDTRFVVPDTNTAADVEAFGVVFSDVDNEGPTRMQYFAPDGSSLGTFTVPDGPAANESFSFLGVIFDAGERIARVRITQGNAPLADGTNDVSQGGPADVVATDNFVFGVPRAQAPPEEPQPDLTAPDLEVDVPGKRPLKKFLKGVKFTVDPNEESQIDIALVAKAKKATFSANGDVELDSESFDFSTETRDGRLKPKKRLVRKAKRLRAKVEVEAIDRAGNKGSESETIKVKGKKKKKNKNN